MHHDTTGHFPAGNFASRAGVCTGGQPTSEENPSQDHVNWAILILPYLEEHALFEQYDFSTYNEAPENRWCERHESTCIDVHPIRKRHR